MLLCLLPWELIGALLISTQTVSGKSAINVALQASFNSPPFLLELLETTAEENSTAYFPLLDRIAEGRFSDCSTDQELYESFLQVVQDDGHITDPDSLSSLQFALSIHATAPRIQAHYQYYDTSIEPSLMVAQDAACPVWVHFNGKQYCSPALDRAQQDVGRLRRPENLPFDRILGETSDSSPTQSVLYADITSPLFAQFHQTISSTARNGQTSYRIRYRPSAASSERRLVVNGYGVELALKRTDYIVIDDRAAETEGPEGDVAAAESDDVVVEDEEFSDLKPLSSTELLGLGIKAASFVMASENPLETLLKVSQDFPKHSSSIIKRNTSADFVTEHQTNRETFLPSGYNVIWMNGMQVEARQMDAFALLDQLRRERSIIGSIRNLGFTGSEAVQMLSHPAIAEAKAGGDSQRYDYRDTIEGSKVIIWLNDIEKDKRYSGWPEHATALLQRTYPGQLPSVRRDIHNVVIPLDLTDLKDTELVIESLQTFVKRGIPIRFGIVPSINSEAAVQQAVIVYHILDTYGLGAVISYLTESIQDRQLSIAKKSVFNSAVKGRKLRKDQVELNYEDVLKTEDSQTRVQLTQIYLSRLGATGKTLPFFVNGAALPRNEGWLQAMSSKIDIDLRAIQQQVYDEVVNENAWLAGQFLEHAATYRNALIIPEDETTIKLFDVGNLFTKTENIYKDIPRLASRGNPLENYPVQLFVVADLDSAEGSKLAAEALDFAKAHEAVELLLLHNPVAASSLSTSVKIYELISEHGYNFRADLLEALLKAPTDEDIELPPEVIGKATEFWQFFQPFAETIGLQPGQQGLLLNGRLVGPIPKALSFTSGDLVQLLRFEKAKRLAPAEMAVTALGFRDRINTPLAAAVLSSIIALSTTSDIPEGIFESAPTLRMDKFNQWESNHTMISAGDVETASIQLVASIDPTSELAQRWIPMLQVLSNLSGVHLKLFLNPKERMQELPIKRFYRHVLDAKPSFDDDGVLRDPQATFEGLPKEALLNLALDVPPAWLVAPKESIYDLDNIKLSALKEDSNVDAIYELEHILIEGHSRDVTNGPPPRGVQLLLGTEKNPHFADTIIMANLGYFQFKANPGYWKIQLQSGRSQEIFNIDSAGQEGYNPQPGDESTEIALMSFQGKTLYPRLSRKPGQESEDVLEAGLETGSPMNYLRKASKFASSVLSTVGLTPPPPAQAEINIFSVASGHLYERMLNIMMVSVMRHTKHTVKFWFIEQFLSPSFKASLPHLSAHYNFDYALVTYKWPHWLRAQSEKQREIWGYKILFLDVLFPLSLEKVIFVDADQIVRTDMYDLVTHDLEGAPYGFTPMCDSREEIEGFRFWKQGYWKSFLRGLPYHISALYVVDLKLFRQVAAGDRLRQQYHQLSADPHSLSNLDQDLPNHMQMQLPIHSLPQEWLWCETWCSDESLKAARTIDLCNNPMTKEPKLERARRQVPEWTLYDEEIAAVLRRDGNGGGGGKGIKAEDERDGEGEGKGKGTRSAEGDTEGEADADQGEEQQEREQEREQEELEQEELEPSGKDFRDEL